MVTVYASIGGYHHRNPTVLELTFLTKYSRALYLGASGLSAQPSSPIAYIFLGNQLAYTYDIDKRGSAPIQPSTHPILPPHFFLAPSTNSFPTFLPHSRHDDRPVRIVSFTCAF